MGIRTINNIPLGQLFKKLRNWIKLF